MPMCLGHLNTADKFQLVYMEDSRPNAKDDKEIVNALKISNNLQKINIIKSNIKCGRRLPKTLAVFGGQSFRLRIHLQFLDYCGKLHLININIIVHIRTFILLTMIILILGGKFRLNEVHMQISHVTFQRWRTLYFFINACRKYSCYL